MGFGFKDPFRDPGDFFDPLPDPINDIDPPDDFIPPTDGRQPFQLGPDLLQRLAEIRSRFVTGGNAVGESSPTARLQDILNRFSDRPIFNREKGALSDIGSNIGIAELQRIFDQGFIKNDQTNKFLERILSGRINQRDGDDPTTPPPTTTGGGGGFPTGSGGGSGLGGIGGIGGNPFGIPFLDFFEDLLRNRLGGPFGLPQDILDQNRAALQGAAGVREQQALSSLGNSLNTRGQLGGGRQVQLGEDISRSTGEQLNQGILSLLTDNARLAIGDRQSAFNQGNQFSSILSGNALGAGQLGLGQDQLALNRELGLGDLSLRNRIFQFDSGLQTFLNNLLISMGLFPGLR